MDALNFAWPNEGTKIKLTDETLSIYSIKLETTDDIDSLGAPCISDLDYSYSKESLYKYNEWTNLTNDKKLSSSFQCLTAEMTRLYMDKEPYQLKSYMGTHCLNATSVPCSIPQIKNIIDTDVQENMKKCQTFWDYNCELIVLWHAKQTADSKCVTPCQTSQYRQASAFLDMNWIMGKWPFRKS